MNWYLIIVLIALGEILAMSKLVAFYVLYRVEAKRKANKAFEEDMKKLKEEREKRASERENRLTDEEIFALRKEKNDEQSD